MIIVVNTNHLRDILLRMTKKIWNHNIFKGKEDQSTHNYIWRSFCTLRFAIIYTYKTNVGRSRINRRGRIYIFQNFKMTQIMILLLARLVLFKTFVSQKLQGVRLHREENDISDKSIESMVVPWRLNFQKNI